MGLSGINTYFYINSVNTNCAAVEATIVAYYLLFCLSYFVNLVYQNDSVKTVVKLVSSSEKFGLFRTAVNAEAAERFRFWLGTPPLSPAHPSGRLPSRRLLRRGSKKIFIN